MIIFIVQFDAETIKPDVSKVYTDQFIYKFSIYPHHFFLA